MDVAQTVQLQQAADYAAQEGLQLAVGKAFAELNKKVIYGAEGEERTATQVLHYQHVAVSLFEDLVQADEIRMGFNLAEGLDLVDDCGVDLGVAIGLLHDFNGD